MSVDRELMEAIESARRLAERARERVDAALRRSTSADVAAEISEMLMDTSEAIALTESALWSIAIDARVRTRLAERDRELEALRRELDRDAWDRYIARVRQAMRDGDPEPDVPLSKREAEWQEWRADALHAREHGPERLG